MSLPGDLKIHHRCDECRLRGEEFFCHLSPLATERFQAIKITSSYSKGSSLFVEGQPTIGVFMLCQGRVKLTTHSRSGKSLILRIAVPGEVLGLTSAMLDLPSEATAEVIEPSQVNFVMKSDFKRFLAQNSDAGMNALRQLSIENKKAYMQIRSLGLSSCVADKLAMLLLDWSRTVPSSNGSVHLKKRYSHEEIAEMIGTSRETVTRILKDFRRRDLIAIDGPDLHILDTHQLEAMISGGN